MPATPSDPEFSAAWQEGLHNGRDSAEVGAYAHTTARWLGPVLTNIDRLCGARLYGIKKPVRFAVQLNLNGSVRNVLASAGSPHWECVRESLATKVLPAPPRDGFWTSVTLY